MICLDEMGPESAKSFPGHGWCGPIPAGERRARAKQEIDYGRRGRGLRLRGLRAGDRRGR